ncbi:MAG: flagellar protein FlaG [Ruminiclostridium sp.]|nr:flagellar protein FlaG [Ruminiclostridium sp.]
MRIDGTDASTFSTIDFSKSNNVTKETQTEPKEKLNLSNTKSISQLSDFEKNELPVSEKVVIDSIERVNRAMSGSNRYFEISIHKKTNSIMVKVLDSDTNQIIREIPPEKILDMVAKLWEMAGLIVDERR